LGAVHDNTHITRDGHRLLPFREGRQRGAHKRDEPYWIIFNTGSGRF
jgi:hypothetical protein